MLYFMNYCTQSTGVGTVTCATTIPVRWQVKLATINHSSTFNFARQSKELDSTSLCKHVIIG